MFGSCLRASSRNKKKNICFFAFVLILLRNRCALPSQDSNTKHLPLICQHCHGKRKQNRTHSHTQSFLRITVPCTHNSMEANITDIIFHTTLSFDPIVRRSILRGGMFKKLQRRRRYHRITIYDFVISAEAYVALVLFYFFTRRAKSIVA